MWWWAALAFGQCPEETVGAARVLAHAEQALTAYVTQDVGTYVAEYAAFETELGCADEAFGTGEAARALRFWGVHAVILDDLLLAQGAFRAAGEVDPEGALPSPVAATLEHLIVTSTNPLRPPQAVPAVEGAEVRVNGRPSTTRSATEPSLVQVVRDDDVVAWTALVPPDEALPSWLIAGELPDRPQPTLADRMGYRMIRLRPGRFAMGSAEEEIGRDFGETLHEVAIERPFLIGATEVTQELWNAVMRRNPSVFPMAGRPVENVTWLQAVAFCNELSKADGFTPAYRIDGRDVTWDRDADGYRLPTEAEWEFAARAGTSLPYAGSDHPDEVAWTRENGEDRTHVPGQKRPNAWGLFDASGNVAEWVWDRWGDYPAEGVVSPAGPEEGASRVFRGGGFTSARADARVADRAVARPDHAGADLGFRLARTP